MKKRNLFAFILLGGLSLSILGAVMQSCGGGTEDNKDLFTIDTSAMKGQYHPDDMLSLAIVNAKQEKIDSVAWFINDKRVAGGAGSNKTDFKLSGQKFGYQNIKAIVYFDGETAEATGRVELVSGIEPKELAYEIVNTYPHEIKAYTQGLEFYRDTLIESTGSGSGNSGTRAISDIRKVNYKTGEVYKRTLLDANDFGEGLTVLNNKIYQLTYKRGKAYVYNADTMQKEAELPYFRQMEGWGLTNDGTNLYMTEGSEKIYIVDPKTLKEVDYLNVYTSGTKIKAVNELEWVDGKIYGNIYQFDAIAVIDPKSGAVEGVVNLVKLKSLVTQHTDIDVLNGIAYNPKTKTFFVTGKNWDKMFEIRIK
ncbi:MAG: glutaminyl-peptide cyclotransferase [Sphingobacteriaceae bacterium]|nr:MAG: glutaminyl-peptide cyclotransferase [Sphingobacteriaceae bacterium]